MILGRTVSLALRLQLDLEGPLSRPLLLDARSIRRLRVNRQDSPNRRIVLLGTASQLTPIDPLIIRILAQLVQRDLLDRDPAPGKGPPGPGAVPRKPIKAGPSNFMLTKIKWGPQANLEP